MGFRKTPSTYPSVAESPAPKKAPRTPSTRGQSNTTTRTTQSRSSTSCVKGRRCISVGSTGRAREHGYAAILVSKVPDEARRQVHLVDGATRAQHAVDGFRHRGV